MIDCFGNEVLEGEYVLFTSAQPGGFRIGKVYEIRPKAICVVWMYPNSEHVHPMPSRLSRPDRIKRVIPKDRHSIILTKEAERRKRGKL